MDDYLTGHEAANVLGVSYHTIMRARRRGLIEAVQKGWQYYFHKAEVARYGDLRTAAIAAGAVSEA